MLGKHLLRIGAPAFMVAGFVLAELPVAAQDPGPRYTQPLDGVQKAVKTFQFPYWRVGNVDKRLSKLCNLGLFNQRRPYSLAGHFAGPQGSAMLGAAKGTGLNLHDPTKAGNPGFDYWFHRDRTSSCIVFSAKVKDGGGGAAPAR